MIAQTNISNWNQDVLHNSSEYKLVHMITVELGFLVTKKIINK